MIDFLIFKLLYLHPQKTSTHIKFKKNDESRNRSKNFRKVGS
jgi:hypothetical protein